ncbi:MAG: two-component system response regulator CreB [Gammaproteobacteria bacterium]|nr:two-component system response regulator CreB [Gammaproteobacteria bacterium]MBQ0774486.1 two-component system response regulator CreB [Gammaproteobacteria bacterium]
MHNILIVDDEQSIADTLLFALQRDCFQAESVSLGANALSRLRTADYDLVILDIGLPDITGFDVCRSLRQFSQVPVLFLTARDEEVDRILGLEMGGDDYVTKPFSPREVVARVRAILKRTTSKPAHAEEEILRYEPDARRLLVKGQSLDLTTAELRLIEVLTQAPSRVFSRQQLLDAIGASYEVLDRSIDTHIKTLRKKLRDAGAGDCIRTHRGLGYSLELS